MDATDEEILTATDDELVKVSQQFELSYVSCLPVDNAIDGARFRESISSEHYTLCASHVLLRKTRIRKNMLRGLLRYLCRPTYYKIRKAASLAPCSISNNFPLHIKRLFSNDLTSFHCQSKTIPCTHKLSVFLNLSIIDTLHMLSYFKVTF